MTRFLMICAFGFLVSSCAPKKTTTDSNSNTETIQDSEMPTSSENASANTNNGKIQHVSPQQFNKLLLLDEVQLVDVRTPDEYNTGHINGAINIDVNQNNFKTKVNQLDKNKPVLVYCRSGKRSNNAAEMLKEMGFKRIVDLEGGILSWEEAKLPIKK